MNEEIANKKIAKLVARQLLNIEAIKFDVHNPFTWASGISSPVYCDNRRINSFIDARNHVLDSLVTVISQNFEQANLIGGIATGGIPMGIMVADRLNLPFVYIRQQPKSHGMKRQIEGFVHPNSKIILIEDLVSTGGSSMKAINGIRENQIEIVALISIMTYSFQKAKQVLKQNDITYLSLSNLNFVLKEAKSMGLLDDSEELTINKFIESPMTWYQ